jgi:hypothetical protein
MRLVFLLLLGLAAGGTHAGTLQGTVRAQPREGTADTTSASGAYDSRKYKFVERVDYAHLTDFVVFLDGPVGTRVIHPSSPSLNPPCKVLQKGAAFIPHVLPVQVGTAVEWPNLDDIFHNVFSYSDAKPFDLGLYKHPELKKVVFDHPGRVDVFCSIHKTMNCIVLVLETPFFAAVDERGRFEIGGIPPGAYRFKAWHERLPAQTREITIPESGIVRTDFTLGVGTLPKY